MSIPSEENMQSALQTFNKLFAIHFSGFEDVIHNLENPSKKNIHTFRVWIKFFRNNLRISESLINDNFKSKNIYKQIRQVYKNAGKMRKYMIFEKITGALEIEKKLKKTIFSKIKEQQLKLVKKLDKTLLEFHPKLFIKSMDKLLLKIDDDHPKIQKERINKHLLYLEKSIIENSIGAETNTHVHALRKDLKSILYTQRIIAAMQIEKPGSENKQIPLKMLEIKLGIHNDLSEYLSFLHEFEDTKNNKGLPLLIKCMNEHVTHSKSNLIAELQNIKF